MEDRSIEVRFTIRGTNTLEGDAGIHATGGQITGRCTLTLLAGYVEPFCDDGDWSDGQVEESFCAIKAALEGALDLPDFLELDSWDLVD